MISNKAIRKEALNLLKKNRITCPTLENIAYFIESEGYEIIDFDPSESDGGVAAEYAPSLSERFKNEKGFVFQNERIKAVFLNERLDTNEKKYVLAHELGHIIFKHSELGQPEGTVEEEYAANEFAHFLINPGKISGLILKCSFYIKALIAAAIVVVVIIIGAVVVNQIRLERSYYGEYYVTEGGERYHKRNCIVIKDKTNVCRLTKEAFESGEYSPCQVCLPND